LIIGSLLVQINKPNACPYYPLLWVEFIKMLTVKKKELRMQELCYAFGRNTYGREGKGGKQDWTEGSVKL
jgi:hypothetical protein